MITWNRIFFHTPSCYIIELVVIIHDYVIILLFSMLVVVLINAIFLIYTKNFNIYFYEDHQLEIVWTIVPFIFLLLILIPSLNSLYMLDACLFCGLSIRIIAHQWYWRYHYNDLTNTLFDSYIIPSDENCIRLLDVDNRLIVPNRAPVRFAVTSADVVHSWTVPSFGVKIDAVPGRLNQFCFTSKRPGIFFGQCSEICGANHRFIPIVVESVNFKNFMSSF